MYAIKYNLVYWEMQDKSNQGEALEDWNSTLMHYQKKDHQEAAPE